LDDKILLSAIRRLTEDTEVVARLCELKILDECRLDFPIESAMFSPSWDGSADLVEKKGEQKGLLAPMTFVLVLPTPGAALAPAVERWVDGAVHAPGAAGWPGFNVTRSIKHGES
jgi:hypothetical protein